MWLALGMSLAAAGGNVLGGVFVVHREWPRRVLSFFLALGAGFMLATSLVEIIPEAIRLAGNAALFAVLAGYFLVHFFEHTVAHHFHFGEETHAHEMQARHASVSALAGLSIHTFFDGVAIASGFLVSNWLGTVIFLAVFLHKLPEGFTVSSLLLAGGGTRKTALWGSVILGGATVMGVLLMGVVKASVSYALPISGGVTLYVAATDLIPEVNRERSPGGMALIFLGVALFFAIRKLFGIQ